MVLLLRKLLLLLLTITLRVVEIALQRRHQLQELFLVCCTVIDEFNDRGSCFVFFSGQKLETVPTGLILLNESHRISNRALY